MNRAEQFVPDSRIAREALLIAHAVVHPQRRREVVERTEGSLSPSARSLLLQLANDAAPGWYLEPDDVMVNTKAERELADRVDAITVADLCLWGFQFAIDMVTHNPPPVREREPAADRHLARRLGMAAR